MSAVTFERIIHTRGPSAPRMRAALMTSAALVAQSVRAARELDAVVSPGAQLRVAQRFASRI